MLTGWLKRHAKAVASGQRNPEARIRLFSQRYRSWASLTPSTTKTERHSHRLQNQAKRTISPRILKSRWRSMHSFTEKKLWILPGSIVIDFLKHRSCHPLQVRRNFSNHAIRYARKSRKRPPQSRKRTTPAGAVDGAKRTLLKWKTSNQPPKTETLYRKESRRPLG